MLSVGQAYLFAIAHEDANTFLKGTFEEGIL